MGLFSKAKSAPAPPNYPRPLPISAEDDYSTRDGRLRAFERRLSPVTAAVGVTFTRGRGLEEAVALVWEIFKGTELRDQSSEYASLLYVPMGMRPAEVLEDIDQAMGVTQERLIASGVPRNERMAIVERAGPTKSLLTNMYPPAGGPAFERWLNDDAFALEAMAYHTVMFGRLRTAGKL